MTEILRLIERERKKRQKTSKLQRFRGRKISVFLSITVTHFLHQWFSTWGLGTPGVHEAQLGVGDLSFFFFLLLHCYSAGNHSLQTPKLLYLYTIMFTFVMSYSFILNLFGCDV